MSLTNLALAAWILLQSGNQLNWWNVQQRIIAIIGVIFVLLLVLAVTGVWSYNLPVKVKRR